MVKHGRCGEAGWKKRWGRFVGKRWDVLWYGHGGSSVIMIGEVGKFCSSFFILGQAPATIDPLIIE